MFGLFGFTSTSAIGIATDAVSDAAFVSTPTVQYVSLVVAFISCMVGAVVVCGNQTAAAMKTQKLQTTTTTTTSTAPADGSGRAVKGKKPLSKKAQTPYTMAEVQQHTTEDDLWIVVGDGVYNVTKWMPYHPGGVGTILRFGGMDATDELMQFHKQFVLDKKLPNFRVGTLVDAPEPTFVQKEFRAFFRKAEVDGMLEPTPGYYAVRLTLILMLLAASVGLVLSAKGSDAPTAKVFAAAVLLAAFFQQLAFIGHDTGHQTLCVDREKDDKFGLAWGNMLTGVSIAWWKASHYVHHAVPNSVEHDPDIAHMPVFAVTPSFFDDIYHSFHSRVMPFDWAARTLFIPYQHYLYYPIMAVARVNLYIQGIIRLIKSPAHPGTDSKRVPEIIALCVFFTWMTCLVRCIDGGANKAMFLFVSHALAGILHVQITLSHFACEVMSEAELGSPDTARDDTVYGGDFYTRSIKSSLDVDCHPWMDWFHGGLQFQVIHHCFPRVCRANLRSLVPAFTELCERTGLDYRRETFYNANVAVINTLKKTAMEAKEWSPCIGDMVNARG